MHTSIRPQPLSLMLHRWTSAQAADTWILWATTWRPCRPQSGPSSELPAAQEASRGVRITGAGPVLHRLRGRRRKVLQAARAAGVTVIHTREGHRPGLQDLPASKHFRSKAVGAAHGFPPPRSLLTYLRTPGVHHRRQAVWCLVRQAVAPPPDDVPPHSNAQGPPLGSRGLWVVS